MALIFDEHVSDAIHYLDLFCWAEHAFFEICLFTLHRDESQAINKTDSIQRIHFFPVLLLLLLAFFPL